MSEFNLPRTEIEWSRRAIINVVAVLAAHAESLTLPCGATSIDRVFDQWCDVLPI